MIQHSEMDALQKRVFGDFGGENAEKLLRREIASKLSELRRLNEQLEELVSCGGGAIDPVRVSRSLSDECPYLELAVDTVSRNESATGMEVIFTTKVKAAPFHVFDSGGNPQFTTLPLNDIGLRMNPESIIGVYIRPTYWKRQLSRYIDFGHGGDEGVPLEQYSNVVSGGRSFGHPHFSEAVSLLDDGTGLSSPSHMCTGNNDMPSLLRNLSSPTKLVLLLRCANAWMVDLNLGSMFSTRMTPLATVDSYRREVLIPACAELRGELIEFVKSDGYREFVENANAGNAAAMSEFCGEQLGFVGRIAPAIDDITKTSVKGFCEAYRETRGSLAALTLGLHQYIGAMRILSTRSGCSSYRLMEAACAVLLMGGYVWKDPQSAAHLTNRNGGLSRKAAQLYVADYGRMINGDYSM